MKVPERYLDFRGRGNRLFPVAPDCRTDYPRWPNVNVYPPIGSLPFYLPGAFHSECFYFYWPIGREADEPLACHSYDDLSELTPRAVNLEGLLKLRAFEGRHIPDEEFDNSEEIVDVQFMAEVLGCRLPPPQLAPPPAVEEQFRIVPDSPAVLLVLGEAAMESGRDDEAERLLLGAVSLLPEYTNALFALARLYHKQRRHHEAVQFMLETLGAPLCFGGGHKQCLEWLKNFRDEDYPELKHHPLWTRRHALTLKTGVKHNDDFLHYEAAIEEFLQQGEGVRAIRLRILEGERMSHETVAFRERYGFSTERYKELLTDNLQRAGLDARLAPIEWENEWLERIDPKPHRLILQSIGDSPAKVFVILRRIIGLSPLETKRLLTEAPFEIVQGTMNDLAPLQKEFEVAGATVRQERI